MPRSFHRHSVRRTALGFTAAGVGVVAWFALAPRAVNSASSLRAGAAFSRVAAPPRAGIAATSVTRESEPVGGWAGVSEEELVAFARRRIAGAPADALAWAESHADPADRERLLVALVQAWAEGDPIAAARWALARERVCTEPFMAAVFAGAALQPALAMEIGRRLLAADPEIGAAHGATLVGALTGAGEFATAFTFAREAPSELREEWLAAALRRWAAQKPQDALQALGSLSVEALRGPLFRSLADGWAERDPAGLAAYTLAQPASPERDRALTTAVLKWGERDPAAMATWLNTLPRGVEFDTGAAVLLLSTDSANRSVEVALRWVENIDAPELRRESLSHVLNEWHQNDPAAARAYLERVAWLVPEQRSALRKSLERSAADRLEIVSAK